MESNISPDTIQDLQIKSLEARILVIETLAQAGSGHTAGSLGLADIVSALYFHLLNHKPDQPNWSDRDRLVLSHGHVCPILYAAMAMTGYFPTTELSTLRQIDSRLQGHPHRTALPGLETSSGPLGEGLSQGIGIALAAKSDHKNYHTYVLTSDGEQQEGNTWEAVMLAAKYQLGNLTTFIDRNFIQIEGNTEDVMPLEDLAAKYLSFNWHVQTIDGHDIAAIIEAVTTAKKTPETPSVIISNTVPGSGVDFMEDKYEWHGKPPTPEEAKTAVAQLKQQIQQIK